MAESTQQALRKALADLLRPIVKLMLMCGLSYAEFSEIAKSIFVSVASDTYGLRGRPTSISRVAAMTGLSRKDVSRIRGNAEAQDWSPRMENSPVNTLLHHWHFDPRFSDGHGGARDLHPRGEGGFRELVKCFAGDIPPGAMLKELKRTDSVVETADGRLAVRRMFSQPSRFDSDFIQNLGFAMANLGSTLVHNAEIVRSEVPSERQSTDGFLERAAWTELLSRSELERFRSWVRAHGSRFIQEADHWIGENEQPASEGELTGSAIAGVGVYYFEK